MKITKDVMGNIFTALLSACALCVTAICVIQFIHRNDPPSMGSIESWKKLTANRKVTLGDQAAKHKIIEFTDYQCPYCRAMAPVIKAIVDKNPGKVSVYRYDLPLTKIHSHAFEAAVASHCATREGASIEYSEALYQADLDTIDYTDLAKKFNIESVEGFEKCFRNPSAVTSITQDIRTAAALGIDSTPTLIVDGKIVTGIMTEEQLEELAL